MSSEFVCQIARSWVNVNSFHARLFIIFMCKASVSNVFDYPRIYDSCTLVPERAMLTYNYTFSLSQNHMDVSGQHHVPYAVRRQSKNV
jgi:hypothetical protein